MSALPAGAHDPRPITPFDLSLDIATELRAEGLMNSRESDQASRIVERMIVDAIKNGGIRV